MRCRSLLDVLALLQRQDGEANENTVVRDDIYHFPDFFDAAVERFLDNNLPKHENKGIELKAPLAEAKHHTSASRPQPVQRHVGGPDAIGAHRGTIEPNAVGESGHMLEGLRVFEADGEVWPWVSRYISR